MQKFNYKALDGEKIIKGQLEEDNIQFAFNKLKGMNLKVIYIKPVVGIKELIGYRSILKSAEVANLCEQLALIVNSGINLIKGLEIIIQQSDNNHIKDVMNIVINQVKKGNSLGKAMESTGAFPKLLTDMVLSGELTGDVDTVLYDMESFYQREANISNKLKNASIYPIVILLTTLGMILFFDIFIFKNLKDIFGLDDNLPSITKALIGVMDSINNNYIETIVTILIIIIGGNYISSLKKVKYFIDYLKLKAPVINKVKRDVITSRFTRSMGIFLKSGLPMIKILDNLELILGNEYYSHRINGVKESIINGGRICDSIEKLHLFDPLVTQMINVGEETGSLDESFFKLADVYDKKVEVGIERLMALVEPTFTLIIGLFVAFIVLAIALPILQMSNVIK